MKSENPLLEYFQKKSRYTRGGEIGAGGMAVVTQYLDEYFHRTTAHKTLKSHRKSRHQVDEFLREAKVMSKLEHPGIVPIHELVLSDDGTPGIIMNKIDGRPLSVLIQENARNPEKWPLSQRISIFARLVEVVDYAHSMGILHRDLKPSNVMVGEHGYVTLLDWGLAKLKGGEVRDEEKAVQPDQGMYQSMEGSTKGTPLYMPPEAAMGHTNEVDERSDLFSLGVILFEMLTFQRMIKGGTAMEIVKNAVDGEYNLYLLTTRGIPADLAHITRKCVQRSPQKRYQSAEFLRQDIYSYQHGLPLTDFEYNAFHYTRKWLRRNWAAAILFTLVAAVFSFIGANLIKRFLELEGERSNFKKHISAMGHESQEKEEDLRWREERNNRLEKEISVLSGKEQKLAEEIAEAETRLAEVGKNAEEKTLEMNDWVKKINLQKGELWTIQNTLRDITQKLDDMKKEQRQESKEILRQLFIKKAPELGRRLQEISRRFHGGSPVSAVKMLADTKAGSEILAVNILKERILKLVTVGKTKPIPEKQELVSHYPEGLLDRDNDPRLPKKIWTHAIRRDQPPGEILVAADGAVVFLPDKSKSFVPLKPHSNNPVFIRLAGGGSYGLYRSDFAFVQQKLDEEPFAVQLPWPADHVLAMEDGSLRLQHGDDTVMVRPYQRQLSPATLPIMEEVPADRRKEKPASAAQPAKDLLPPGMKRLASSFDGRFLLGISSSETNTTVAHLKAGAMEILEKWTFPADIKPQVAASEDGNWLLLHGEGRLYQLRCGYPARPVVNPDGKQPLQIFGFPLQNLALVSSRENEIFLLMLNTGQTLYSAGFLNEALMDAWEFPDGSIVMQTLSGMQYQIKSKT